MKIFLLLFFNFFLLCANEGNISIAPQSIVVNEPAAQENFGRGRINGVVVDENGAPVEDALVVAESQRGETKLEGRSDKKGRFAIAGLGTGAWRITASKSGYINSDVRMNVKQLSTNPPITFTLNKIKGVDAVTSDKESAALFEQGDTLLNRGNYEEARKVFEAFAGKYPEIYQVHLNIGTCYVKAGELDKARAEFQPALDKLLAAHGDYKKDAAAAQKAFSGLGEVALRRGDLEMGRKYFSQALDSFNKFIQLDPENPNVSQVKNIIATIEKMKK